MTITLPLQPHEEARLAAIAAARGLTTSALVREALESILSLVQPSRSRPLQTAAEIVLECMADVLPEDFASLPHDGAAQHDHYIYGLPRREA